MTIDLHGAVGSLTIPPSSSLSLSATAKMLDVFCGVGIVLAEEGAFGLAPTVKDRGGSSLSACRKWEILDRFELIGMLWCLGIGSVLELCQEVKGSSWARYIHLSYKPSRWIANDYLGGTHWRCCSSATRCCSLSSTRSRGDSVQSIFER